MAASHFFPVLCLVTKLKEDENEIWNNSSIPDLRRYPGKEMATHSKLLAWEILRTEEPGGLQSMRLQKSRTKLINETTNVITFLYTVFGEF